MDLFPIGAFFVDRSEQFRDIASSIEQKLIRRNNQEVPAKSRRDENRPSKTFATISSSLIPLADEMHNFRKMLEEKTQDYIFASTFYSKMSVEEREELDESIQLCLTHFTTLMNQIGSRITMSEGFKNPTERVHLQRVHENLQAYLKEIAEYSALIKKEHLKRLQFKNRSLPDRIKEVQKAGRKFKYMEGVEELAEDPELDINAKSVRKLEELLEKHKCLEIKKKEVEEYDWIEKGETEVKDQEVEEVEGWESLEMEVPEMVIRNRKPPTAVTSDPDEIHDSYQRWKESEGSQFLEKLQEQTMEMREEYVSREKDDEIEKLEEQICEIQSLSSVFSEKIMDQERDIDIINDLALHTTENLVDGNEWIRKAITNSALRRVILLFCIIVLTFTLLFLDWYNP